MQTPVSHIVAVGERGCNVYICIYLCLQYEYGPELLHFVQVAQVVLWGVIVVYKCVNGLDKNMTDDRFHKGAKWVTCNKVSQIDLWVLLPQEWIYFQHYASTSHTDM